MATSATATSDGRRSWGIDRKTVAPALLVLALAVLLSIVLPSLNSATTYKREIRTGDVAAVADGITLVPSPGWALASGALVGRTRSPVGTSGTTELIDGGVDLYVHAAPFDGTPSALLTRIDDINAALHHARSRDDQSTDRYAVTTDQGSVGVAEDFVGTTRQGSVVAFVLDVGKPSPTGAARTTSEGVEVIVSGPNGSMSRARDDAVAMIRSIKVAR
jgi:hypothetical protein